MNPSFNTFLVRFTRFFKIILLVNVFFFFFKCSSMYSMVHNAFILLHFKIYLKYVNFNLSVKPTASFIPGAK